MGSSDISEETIDKVGTERVEMDIIIRQDNDLTDTISNLGSHVKLNHCDEIGLKPADMEPTNKINIP